MVGSLQMETCHYNIGSRHIASSVNFTVTHGVQCKQMPLHSIESIVMKDSAHQNFKTQYS